MEYSMYIYIVRMVVGVRIRYMTNFHAANVCMHYFNLILSICQKKTISVLLYYLEFDVQFFLLNFFSSSVFFFCFENYR